MVALRRQALMKLSGFLLCLAVTAAAFAGVSPIVAADSYPNRPIRWIVPFSAGGASDIVARVLGEYLSQHFGEQIIIENKPGAGGNLGVQSILNATPDGYTIGLVGPSIAISATLYKKLPFDFIRDSVSVAGVMRSTNVMEVHPSVPAKSVADFIAYAKAHPGKLNMASSGVGASAHMSGELFKMMTGVDMLHVPYRGGAPAVAALITGEAQVLFDNLPGSIEHIRNGNVRALAVTTAKRSDVIPSVPTIAETVPGYEASTWYALVAPKGTPSDVVDKLNRAVNLLLGNPKVQGRFTELGGEAMPMMPNELSNLIADEIEKWAKVVKFSGAKLE
jgi:tripartite-type tricarboxylate transporter receptor subunit TctC